MKCNYQVNQIPIRTEFLIAVSTSFFWSSFEKDDVDDGDGNTWLLCFCFCFLEDDDENFSRSSVFVLEKELAERMDVASSSFWDSIG